MLYLFLQRRTKVFSQPTRLLEVAPSGPVVPRLAGSPTVEYVGADLTGRTGIALRADITKLGLATRAFDAAICFHVLEHIPDDLAAMRELRRVLRPGAAVIIQVPLLVDVTDEDPRAAPEERAARFGQADHVRNYGWDLVSRLTSTGFAVDQYEPTDYLSDDEVRRFGISGDDYWIFTARA